MLGSLTGISCAVRSYFRFQLSLRDIEELRSERGVIVSYETVRRWCDKFGACFAHRVKTARRRPGTTWHLDEVFVTLRGAPSISNQYVRRERVRSTWCVQVSQINSLSPSNC
jgi:transposase-like protein